jgi:hypothetical protein
MENLVVVLRGTSDENRIFVLVDHVWLEEPFQACA